MGRPVELVVFDCDGVLVDSERIALRCQVAVGAELGWPITGAEVLELFIGRSAASVGEQVAARLGVAAARRWDERFRELHHREVEAGLAAVEGIAEALDGIGRPFCVASSGGHEKMRHTLGRTGLYERFAGRIFSAEEVARGKPAPDLFLYAAERMGFAPAACAVVEDSRYGVQAARAAGMRAFGYAGGVTPASWLEGPGTVVFEDVRKLPELLAAAEN
ncbi:HAD family hydrolase [Kitasatospora camelliae]|uniref:HAD family hydrolase n=1 Tax=Kitasatospora camelliae TaxID=3156397 RepID=A0AAU8JVS8_9ACTN